MIVSNKYSLLLCLIALSTFLSCRKQENPIILDNDPQNFGQVFEQFWTQMNRRYMYWDIDHTNWDKIHDVYLNKFSGLDLNSTEDVDLAKSYFTEITSDLVDNHFSITLSFPNSQKLTINPSEQRKLKQPDFRSPFSYLDLSKQYLDKDYKYGSFINSDNRTMYVQSGTINNQLIYFACSEFSLEEAFKKNDGNSVKLILEDFFDKLAKNRGDYKGLIIDLRNNRGGNVADIDFLLGKLTQKQIDFGLTYSKFNLGRLDFTPSLPAKIVPEGSLKIPLKIMVLTDVYTYSTAELFTMAASLIPGTTVIGEKTSGATGIMTDQTLFNTGSFDIGTFISVTASSVAFKFSDGKSYESIGFPAKITVPYDLAEINHKKDIQLLKAISAF